MKVSLAWLQDHVELSGRTTAEFSDLLTFAGIEVEGIEERGGGLDHVVVGEVLTRDPHPDADKLSVCTVNTGESAPRQIVCGADNYKVGDRVPVATPGAELPGGFKIKESKLRGVPSAGMMCGAPEIGLTSDVDGLMILEGNPEPGTPMADLVDGDTIMEVEVTPNRPDLLSHLGVARELAALAELELKSPVDHSVSTTSPQPATAADVTIAPDAACPLYTARRISGVKVAPSPEWLVTKLEAIGLRPINNIVDITNFVLMEMGQPLHAFDEAKLDGGIQVRNATEGEKFVALDGETYPLKAADMVIADQSKAVAIAGVMGGEDTGVTDTTTDVLLESAYFTPSNVRATSRHLNLSSDSSYRFERGADPAQVQGASDLATKLILELAGGTASDVLLVAGETPAPPAPVALDHAKAVQLLGADLSPDDMGSILARLGLVATASNADTSTWNIPSYRADLIRHIDLVEEIARVHGIDNIPARTEGTFAGRSAADTAYDIAFALKNQLATLGMYESQGLKLISPAQLDQCLLNSPRERESAVPVRNPLSDDHTTLRPSLIPGLLASAAHNARHGAARIALFEIGTTFPSYGKGPVEKDTLALLLCGANGQPSWEGAPGNCDFHDLAGIVTAIINSDELSLAPKELDLSPLGADIILGAKKGKKIGSIAAVPPFIARDLDLPGDCFVAEIPMDAIRKLAADPIIHQDTGRFPAITRDIAMEVDATLPSADIATFFTNFEEPLLIGSRLFDVFSDPSGEKIPADRKSLAYTLTYRHSERTLESKEVDDAHAKILTRLKAELSVTIR